jgi:hypothetical protein
MSELIARVLHPVSSLQELVAAARQKVYLPDPWPTFLGDPEYFVRGDAGEGWRISAGVSDTVHGFFHLDYDTNRQQFQPSARREPRIITRDPYSIVIASRRPPTVRVGGRDISGQDEHRSILFGSVRLPSGDSLSFDATGIDEESLISMLTSLREANVSLRDRGRS